MYKVVYLLGRCQQGDHQDTVRASCTGYRPGDLDRCTERHFQSDAEVQQADVFFFSWVGGNAIVGNKAITFSAVMAAAENLKSPDAYIKTFQKRREQWVECDASVIDLKAWLWCKDYGSRSLSKAETKLSLDGLVKDGNQQRKNAWLL